MHVAESGEGSRPKRPSIAELRKKVPHSWDPLETRLVYRRVSIRIIWLLYGTRVTPVQVSWVSAVAGVAVGAFLVLSPGRDWALLAAAGSLQLAFLLDHVDGGLARARGTYSAGGVFVDYFVGEALIPITLALALPVFVFVDTGHSFWLYAGAAFAVTRLLHLGVYFSSFIMYLRGRSQTGATSPTSPAPAPGPLRRLLHLGLAPYWVDSKRILTLTALFLLEYTGARMGLTPYVVYGISLGFLGAYLLLGIPAYLIGGLLSAIHSSHGRFETGRG